MNKKLKIATIAVSAIMAGTMAFGMFGCTPKDDGGKINRNPDFKPTVDADGKLTYTANTEINVNIIDSGNADRKISYDTSEIATNWKSLDGQTVVAGDLKPAWKQFGETLKLKFNDTARSGRSGKELSQAITDGDVGDHNLINASSAQIMSNMNSLLDINQYLDYMPNYKAFLEQNPIIQYSLTMNTKNGAMYYIPYFDGNDDIEKYDMVQRQWVRAVLDDANPIAGTTTFKAQAEAKGLTGTSTSAVAFMGTTAADNWVVETTKSGDDSKTVYVKCDYGKALAAAKSAEGLGAAYNEAAGAAYTGESGNIVDIMNAAINAKEGAVTGAQLAKILREYIKVAYYVGDTADAAKNSSTAMYSAANLADVFNSTSAAWDADLMTAMFRCVVTNYDQFPGMTGIGAQYVWALAGREMKAQRENDLIALAGELYGVRGMESRLEYTYINSRGGLADARQNVKSYEAAAKLHALAEEGLLFNKAGDTSSTINKISKKDTNMTFMLHDYAQTQTTDGFNASEGWTGTTTADAFKYDFAPILTPVSRWDTDDNGSAETVMRFTESWRSVKNTGVCIPTASIGDDANKLAAILAFIDYLYSNDGQIVGSYGTQASGKTAADGYWYGTPVTATIGGVSVTNGEGNLEALKTAGVVDTKDGVQYYIAKTEANKDNRAQYFMYGNKIYSGTPYKDRNIPTMTDNNKTFFGGGEVEGSGKMDTGNTVGIIKSYKNNYTNYARGIIGAALPIGNKDQGFEYQCTAQCAINGSAVVAAALNNGTIKHVTQEVDRSNWWYTEAATVLPVSSGEGAVIGDQLFLDGSGKDVVGIFNATSSAGVSNVYVDLAFWGYNTNMKIGTNGKPDGDYEMKADAQSLMEYIAGLENNGLATRIGYYSKAWGALLALYR
ncbi:MAG: hypothetical protein K2N14_03015 [Clostridia bacterium]|nr:hypothetical protein [Clostridia bacterium]